MFHPVNARGTAGTAGTAGLRVVQFTTTDAVDQYKILAQLITVQTDSTVSCVSFAVRATGLEVHTLGVT
jgi:hypothetical protein